MRFPRDPHPIADPNGYIFAVLAGMPADHAYKESTMAAFEEFKTVGESKAFAAQQRTHRRGQFAALPFGVSYGNGQVVPARLGTGGHGELDSAIDDMGVGDKSPVQPSSADLVQQTTSELN